MTKKLFTFLTLISLSVFLSAQSLEDKLVNRLRTYADAYTCSDYDCENIPSSQGQKVLAERLKDELKRLGAEDATVDDNAYVYATIKGNMKNAPTIFLSAHLDTTPDAEFNTVAPVIHTYDYNGGDIVINRELGIILTEEGNEFLHDAIGGKVITSDGETLLGGDDKAGMAIIMTLAETFATNPSIPHGDIRIVFTPDEEIGNSTSLLTREKINADFGLVLDSHGFGRIVVENFNATDFIFSVKGLSGFPGTSKRPTPYRIASNFISNFPRDMAAYNSTGMEGYIDHHSFKTGEETIVRGRLRSFRREEMAEYKAMVKQWADETAQDAIDAYEKAIREELEELIKSGNPAATALESLNFKQMKYITVINGEVSGSAREGDPVIVFKLNDSYFNAKEVLEKYPTNYDIIKRAYEMAGVKMYPESSRGGSDACDITYMGIPTYNIFTGSHNEHSRDEWVSSKQMLASYNVAYNYLTMMALQDRNGLLQEGMGMIDDEMNNLQDMINAVSADIMEKYGDSFSNL